MTAYIDPRYQLPPYARSRAQRGEFDRILPDGRKLMLVPALFQAGQLSVSNPPPFHNAGFLATSWDYLDYWDAFTQFVIWDGIGEPSEWSRHMDTGRYRIDGDELLEYVKDRAYDERTIEEHIIHAVLATQGQDRRIGRIDEQLSGTVKLDGMRLFFVESEHTIRDGDICFHVDHVYHYLDRSVVLNLDNLAHGMQRTVIKRLTGRNTINQDALL